MRTLILYITFGIFLTTRAFALESAPYESNSISARLLSVQEGISSDAQTLSAGLDVKLEEGWKTYWRSPGEVGLPPEIDWSDSQNIASVDFQFPAPQRFRAFGIENFGYAKEVLFPIKVTLENPGEAAVLVGDFSLLVCSDVCIPDDFTLSLSIPTGSGIDAAAAALVSKASSKVPLEGETEFVAIATISETDLVVEISAPTPFTNPDIFPEYGQYAAFGAPDIRLSDDGLKLWASLPVLAADSSSTSLSLTVVDGPAAHTIEATFTDIAPNPPYQTSESKGAGSVLWIIFTAFIGGLILNVMPCVLPVLSIKLASALKSREHDLARIRKGFLASALGVLAFMWALAGILIAVRSMGQTVGWGLQFQSPFFLAVMISVLVVFAANMLGAFEISLSQKWMTRISGTGNTGGYLADFSTGALAAVLATPCSAPFLGTAVAFALAGSNTDVFVIFTALGIGLAAPYFAIAARPAFIQKLPKPGQWMVRVKYVLGALLLGTAIWLASVFAAISGLLATGIIALLLLALVLLLTFDRPASLSAKGWASACLLACVLAVPFIINPPPLAAVAQEDQTIWQTFNRSEIPRLVADGKTVFVDATADWCLTCKANKNLVLTRGQVAEALLAENVVPMVADWTRQDEDIARFLRSNNRFGVPFNIVYGPGAPDGIPLPELLTSETVLNALEKAAG